MKTARALLGISALAAASALAQAPLGTVSTVNGVATVTTSTGGTTLVAGAPIVHGSRVVTTSASSVTLRMTNGCTVTVPPAHGVTVLSTMTCQQLQAAVQPVVPVAANDTSVLGQGRSPSFAGMDPVVGLWIAGLVLAIIDDARKDNDTLPPPLSAR
jgi:hypothetical protein